MHKNQKGFAHLGIILGVLAALLIIAIGLFVYSSNKNDSKEVTQSQPTEQTDISGIITELEESISLKSPADVDNLPEVTPESFKAYMRKVLDQEPDENGCITAYSVSKISEINIRGGGGTIEKATGDSSDACFGGGKAVWYFQDGEWMFEAFQGPQTCDFYEDNKIYSEFQESCVVEGEQDLKPNPNGSIVDAL